MNKKSGDERDFNGRDANQLQIVAGQVAVLVHAFQMKVSGERMRVRIARLQDMMGYTVGQSSEDQLPKICEVMGDIIQAELCAVYLLGADKLLRRKAAFHLPATGMPHLVRDGVDIQGIPSVLPLGVGLIGRTMASAEPITFNVEPFMKTASSQRGEGGPDIPGRQGSGLADAYEYRYRVYEPGVDVPLGYGADHDVQCLMTVPLVSGSVMRQTEQRLEGVAVFMNKSASGAAPSGDPCFDEEDTEVMLTAGKLVAAFIRDSAN